MIIQLKAVLVVGSIILLSWWVVAVTEPSMECSTVTGLVMSCSTFITYGSPDPRPGSSCCDAMTSLNLMAESNRTSVCNCFMDLVRSPHPNATAIATLPGFCGLSLGFIIAPNTDCSFVF